MRHAEVVVVDAQLAFQDLKPPDRLYFAKTTHLLDDFRSYGELSARLHGLLLERLVGDEREDRALLGVREREWHRHDLLRVRDEFRLKRMGVRRLS